MPRSSFSHNPLLKVSRPVSACSRCESEPRIIPPRIFILTNFFQVVPPRSRWEPRRMHKAYRILTILVYLSVMVNSQHVLLAKKQAARANVLPPMTNLLGERKEGVNYDQRYSNGPPHANHANSYVAALELRVEKLERRLQYAKTRKASLGFQEPDLSALVDVDRRDSMAVIRAAIHRKAARTREDSDVNSLISDLGFL